MQSEFVDDALENTGRKLVLLLLPDSAQTVAVASLTVIAIALVLYLAWRVRAQQMRPAIAILVIGGVLASPHSLPADLVLVALGLVIWGRATWIDWLLLSVGALIAALTPSINTAMNVRLWSVSRRFAVSSPARTR